MPIKDKEKRRKYHREYMRKRRLEKKTQKEIMKQQAKERKAKEKLKKKAEKSMDIPSVIGAVNKRREWKNPIKPLDPMCQTIQWKLREGKRLTMREMSHMNNCDSCCLAYKEYGYLNSGLGLESFW